MAGTVFTCAERADLATDIVPMCDRFQKLYVECCTAPKAKDEAVGSNINFVLHGAQSSAIAPAPGASLLPR